MSEQEKGNPEKQTTPVLSLLDQFRLQHAQFVQQMNLAQTNLNQFIGAVHACEVMIKKIQEEEVQKVLAEKNSGGQENGEADKQTEE